MSKIETTRAFLLSEIEGLEPFEAVIVATSGSPLHVCEVFRREEGGLEVRVPGRPPIVPPLEPAHRRALADRDFASEDAADQTKPWTRSVADATEAVDLLQQVRMDVFGAKADASVDVAHANHRAAHEVNQKLEVARTRITTIVQEMLDKPPEQDADGDFVLPIGEVHVMVAPRAAPDGTVVIRIFAITIVGMEVTAELGLFLARLNFGLLFGRFALDAIHRSIWFDETLLGEQFRREELEYAIRMVAATADEWDDRLKQMFGGARYQEVLAGRTAESSPPTKPGEGVGMYL